MVGELTNATARICKLLRREPGTAWLLLRLGAWVGILSLAIKLFSLPRAIQLVSPLPRRAAPPGAQFPDASEERYAATLDRLLAGNRFCWTPTCWKRAIVLHRHLTRTGRDAQIVFGARQEASGSLAGHAWVEIAGCPVFEAEPPRYTRTFAYPATKESKQ